MVLLSYQRHFNAVKELIPELYVQGSATADIERDLWGAIDTVYPKADHQHCWLHKMRKVLNYFPQTFPGRGENSSAGDVLCRYEGVGGDTDATSW